MKDCFALLVLESRSTIRHKTLTLGVSNGRTEVSVRVLAIDTCFFQALRCITRDHNISNFHSSYARTNTFNNSSGFVSKDTRKLSLRIQSIKTINISVAKSVGDHFNANLSGLRRIHPNFLNDHWFLGLVSDCSSA